MFLLGKQAIVPSNFYSFIYFCSILSASFSCTWKSQIDVHYIRYRFCRWQAWHVTEGFSTWKEFKAQRELDAWLTIKLGKTRLKWQLACGEEPSLLSRSGVRPLTGTAVDKTELNLVPTSFILQQINSNHSGRTRRNNRRCNRKISKN